MALRFLTDHCIANTIVRALRDAAHEVVRLKDVLPVESPDTIVIGKAQEIDAILLSMNGDFADIVTCPPNIKCTYFGTFAAFKASVAFDTLFSSEVTAACCEGVAVPATYAS